MLAFPVMLVSAAQKVGMKVPEDPDNFNSEEFVHFAVFCNCQLCRAMQPGEQFDNAKVLMQFNEEQLKTATVEDLTKAGFAF